MEQESIIIPILSNVKFNILVYLMGCYIYLTYSDLKLVTEWNPCVLCRMKFSCDA